MKPLDYFEHGHRVRLIGGPLALERIPALLSNVNAARVMIITDENVVKAGLLKLVRNCLEGEISIGIVIDQAASDSGVAEMHRIAGLFTRNRCDAIVAVGGGSVIDTAKVLNIIATEEIEDVTRLAGSGALRHSLYPLIAVPTTAASGSETSCTAIITDPLKQHKWFFISPVVLPYASVLDPRMTVTLSPQMTASGAMCTIGHAIEACLSLARNPVSSAYAIDAIGLIKANLFKVMRNLDDLSGRMALQLAACMAGMAISESFPGVIYALAHGLSALCDVPYMGCIAVLLPYGLSHRLRNADSAVNEIFLHLAGTKRYIQTPNHLRAERLIATIGQMSRELQHLTQGAYVASLADLVHLETLSDCPPDILKMTARAAQNNVAQFFNAEKTDQSELERILKNAWKGRYT